MRQHRSPGRVQFPLHALSFRASLVVSVAMAVALLVFGRAEASVFQQMRGAIESATSPLYEFMGPPINTARSFIGNIFSIGEVYRENRLLRAENAKLKAWRERALALEQENVRLSALLELPFEPDIQYRTGRVIDDPGGPFVRMFRVNLGTRDGVVEGQAVTDAYGLVGRIVSAGATASRILLITDLNSRIPVMIEPGGVRGMLIGQNDGLPVVDFLPLDHQIAAGARVVTSGNGGMFPPNILVGEVTEVRDDEVIVRPATRFDRVMYVRVIEYTEPQADVPYSTDGPPVLNAEPDASAAPAQTTLNAASTTGAIGASSTAPQTAPRPQ